MTEIQQVLFEVAADYFGHPYYVTGHALFNAVARRVTAEARQAVHVSHGVFVPGEYGQFPAWHSESGGFRVSGSLPPVRTYDDLFLFRDAAQRWLLESRPRDAHNTHDLQSHGGRVAFASRCWFGRPPEVRNSKRSVQWYVHCYVHASDGAGDGVVPVSSDVLDGVRVGGGRNYGLGELRLVDTQTVELESLEYSRLTEAAADAYVLEVVSPYVLHSEYPGADAQSIPWWWNASSTGVAASTSASRGAESGVRRREERLVVGDAVHVLDTVDHGQVVGYAGDDPVGTAHNGVLRVGTHAKYGFGELRVRPRSDYAEIFGEERCGDAVSGRCES